MSNIYIFIHTYFFKPNFQEKILYYVTSPLILSLSNSGHKNSIDQLIYKLKKLVILKVTLKDSYEIIFDRFDQI